MMKHCIAVQEILQRTVVVEADSIEEAELAVRKAYEAGEIVLDADDLTPDPVSGERCTFFEADWYDKEDVQNMDVSLHTKEEEA